MENAKKGFTLLEIIAAITLMLVIVSVAMPMYGKTVHEQKLKTDKITAMQIYQMANTYLMENKTASETDIKKYVADNYGGQIPKPQSSTDSFVIKLNGDKVSVSLGSSTLVSDGVLQ